MPLMLLVLALWLPLAAAAAEATPGFVGSARCGHCHAAELKSWRGSDHDLAMTEASPKTVLGDFNDAEFTAHGVTSRFYKKNGQFFVHTDGPDGKLHDYQIRYTFGWYPLQQYLIEFPRGRLQSLGIAWDSRPTQAGGQRWFHLYPAEDLKPGDPLHWTGRDQTWNYQCAECHSTHLKKNYDLATDSYKTTWAEIDVACEACHGPGSEHVARAEAARRGELPSTAAGEGLVVDLADRDGATWVIDEANGKPHRTKPRKSHTQIELCARCHSRRGQIWDDYQYGKPLYQTHRLALLEEPLYFPDGQIKGEVYVYGSFLQSRMYRAGVTCSDCHDSHSLKRRAEGNALCGRCHQPARYDSTTHHHHRKDSPGAACTACHMPKRTYMVVDRRADHSLRVPRPDLSLSLGVPNACNGCHTDRSVQWAADTVNRWYPDSTHRGPHFGQALRAAQVGAPDAAARLLALAGDPTQPAIARATALERLRDEARPEQLFTVRRLLTDEDALVRAAAVHYLEATDLRTRVDLAWPLLDDPARTVRLEAVRVLAPLMRQGLPDTYRDKLARALDDYAAAQAVSAERPESQLNLGLLALARGAPDQAESAYRTALRLDPSFAPAYVNLADLYRQTGRDHEGEAILRSGIEKVAGAADLHYSLGLLLVRAKRPEEAARELERAWRLASANARYGYVYGLALQSLGRQMEALAVLRQALEQDPGDREVLVALATLSRDAGDLTAARGYAARLAERYPEDPDAQALLQTLTGADKGGDNAQSE
jgi:Tfp pilus assembly protein PilF